MPVPDARFAGATAGAPLYPDRVWWQRAVPFALAASLVLVVSGAFIYQATEHSPTLLAAELTADHVKCFAVNTVLDPTRDVARIEQSLNAQFGWSLRLPEVSERTGLELVGERPCLYGEGKVAHIMYRYHGDPVSLFLLPKSASSKEVVDVMGHKAAIWSDGQHTFVLIAREKPSEVARMAAVVRAGIQ